MVGGTTYRAVLQTPSAVHSTPSAANSVGSGPQIKFGATEVGRGMMEATGRPIPRHARPTTATPAAPFPAIPTPTTVIPAPRRGYLAERGTSAPNRPQPSSRPPVRRPKLDLGPIRRWSAARRTEMPCKRASADHSTLSAANGVGYGPQIKFGATDLGARHAGGDRSPRHCHTRAPFSVIPALRRGYLDERGTSAPNRPQPSSRPPVRRPKLDLGPIRRSSAARRTEMPRKRRWRATPPSALRTALGWAPNQVWGDGSWSTA